MIRSKKPYFFWLIPSGSVYTKLKKIIEQLSRKYSTPRFEPHVTLLHYLLGYEEEMVSKIAQLANLLQPYEIELTKIGFSNDYFKRVYANAKKTRQVMEANLKAKEVFDSRFDREYIPHLSLMYGNLPVEEKNELKKNLGHSFDIKFVAKDIHLFSSVSNNIKKVEWYRVRKFSLKQNFP